MTVQHEDVYFKYTFTETPSVGHIYHVYSFTFNNEEHKFGRDNKFLFGTPNIVTVYACEKGGSFMRTAQYEGVTNYLKSFFTDLKDSGASIAHYYVYQKMSGSTITSSAIEPAKLASYLGGSNESDRKHKNVSGANWNYVSSFNPGTGSHSFEITFKGATETVKNASGSEANLTRKSSSSLQRVSGSVSFWNPKTSKRPVIESQSGETKKVEKPESPQPPKEASRRSAGNSSSNSGGSGGGEGSEHVNPAAETSKVNSNDPPQKSAEVPPVKADDSAGLRPSSSTSSPESEEQISEKSAKQETSKESAEQPSKVDSEKSSELNSAPLTGESDNSEPSAPSASTNEGGKTVSTGNTQESQRGSQTSVETSDTNSGDSAASPDSEVPSGEGEAKQVEQSDSQDSDEKTVIVNDSPGSTGSPEKSQSSSNIPWIVGGTVIGSVGLIGTGILIYKCIR
ncbi:hypothetical protein BdWA1_001033 [Babesia duncani]|uniref:Uncharacterized protein n=1 Tax=Babesia duncani TaxID=323732 RepID=A0AAD9PP99_9APIC|nr:hypothetical protein BdWA1_001033 [Babesia duncani]